MTNVLPRSGPLPRPKNLDEAAQILESEAMLKPSGVEEVTMTCIEFTSQCPRTGQPDFGIVEIYYTPLDLIIESKALKFYLWAFRDIGMLCETLADRIAGDVMTAIKPSSVRVKVTQKLPRWHWHPGDGEAMNDPRDCGGPHQPVELFGELVCIQCLFQTEEEDRKEANEGMPMLSLALRELLNRTAPMTADEEAVMGCSCPHCKTFQLVQIPPGDGPQFKDFCKSLGVSLLSDKRRGYLHKQRQFIREATHIVVDPITGEVAGVHPAVG